jgi:lysophospholipase L1-like esterase
MFHWTAAALTLSLAGTAALQLASLGSSFAAGPGIPGRANYAHLLAARLDAKLSDLSVSGSTLLSISSQIARIPPTSDVVTVTSGGNDLGYVAGLMADSSSGARRGRGSSSSARAQGAGLISEEALLGRWNSALARIHAQAPRAKVYLVEYLTVLGPNVRPGVDVPFGAAAVEHHRRVAAALRNATSQAAVGKNWVEDVPVAQASANHGVGSPDPWINGAGGGGARGGVAWHPNSAGMKAIADMLYARIKGAS